MCIWYCGSSISLVSLYFQTWHIYLNTSLNATHILDTGRCKDLVQSSSCLTQPLPNIDLNSLALLEHPGFELQPTQISLVWVKSDSIHIRSCPKLIYLTQQLPNTDWDSLGLIEYLWIELQPNNSFRFLHYAKKKNKLFLFPSHFSFFSITLLSNKT